MPISFAFIEDCKNPGQCYALIKNKLAHAGKDVFYIEADLPSEEGGAEPKKKIMVLVGVAIFLIVLAGSFFWLGSGKKSPDAESGIAETVAPPPKQETQTFAPPITNEIGQKTIPQIPQGDKPEPKAEIPDEKPIPEEILPEICAKKAVIPDEALKPYAKKYLESLCSKNTVELPPFEKMPGAKENERLTLIWEGNNKEIDQRIVKQLEKDFKKGRPR